MSNRPHTKPIVNTLNGKSIIGQPTAILNTLQYDAINDVFIWVASSSGGDGGSSEQFYQDKIVAGDSFEVSGDISDFEDTIEFIVPDEKTAFLVEAKITMSTNPSNVVGSNTMSVSDQVVAVLKIAGVEKSKAKIGIYSSYSNLFSASEGAGLGYGVSSSSLFNFKMLSLVGDGVKKIEIENILDDGNAFAEMSGYLIDT